MPKLEQRYDRTYAAGRPTAGWDRGERITDTAAVKPGDVLINVCHQFQAENLMLVIPKPDGFMDIPGRKIFYAVWADNQTATRTGPEMMSIFDSELHGPQREFYCAIDKRPPDPSKTRIPAEELPSWLSYNSSV